MPMLLSSTSKIPEAMSTTNNLERNCQQLWRQPSARVRHVRESAGVRRAWMPGLLARPRKIPSRGLRSHLINRQRVRCKGFGAAARREEGEYPSWICDRRATKRRRQRPATRRAGFWRPAGCVAPRSQSADGYAPSSRLASRPPEASAPISYL
jgi:hypothetical protein